MQHRLKGFSGLGPDWQKLSPELAFRVWQHLNFADLLRAELCCRTWHFLLSQPQVLNIHLTTLLEVVTTTLTPCPCDRGRLAHVSVLR